MILSIAMLASLLTFMAPVALADDPIEVGGFIYPVTRELYMGVSTTSVNASPLPHAEANGRIRWYVNSWTGDAQQIATNHPNAPLRAAINAARYMVVEYTNAPPAGNRLILSLQGTGDWGHNYAQAIARPESETISLYGDGVSKIFVFDLGESPLTGESVTATAASYGLTINTQAGLGAPAVRAYLANTREEGEEEDDDEPIIDEKPVFPVLFENGQWADVLGEIVQQTPGGASTVAYENGMIRLYNGVPTSRNIDFRFVFENLVDIRGYSAVIMELEEAPTGWFRAMLRFRIDEDTRFDSSAHTATIRMTGGVDRQRLRGVGALPNFGQTVKIKKIYLEGDGVITTSSAISQRNIMDVIPPRTGNTPVREITTSGQYTGTVQWSPNHATFQPNTEYTATITLTPKIGWTLSGVAANWFRLYNPIGTGTGATGTGYGTTHAANSGVITKTFPATIPIVPYPEPTQFVAFSYDDMYMPDANAFLDVVGSLGIKVTIFANGINIEKARIDPTYKAIIDKAVAAGHEFGNHAWQHERWNQDADVDVMKTDFKRNQDLILELTGQTAKWMRVPYASHTANSLAAAGELGMSNLRGLATDDWDLQNSSSFLVNRILTSTGANRLTDGQIYVNHIQLGQTNTMQALPEYVHELRSRGFGFMTCSELREHRNHPVTAGVNYANFFSNITSPAITIGTQPVSPPPENLVTGSISGSLSIAATVTLSATLSYQWYAATFSGCTPIAGATGTTFALPSALTAGNHYYYCVVSAPGAPTLTSNVIAVTVEDPLPPDLLAIWDLILPQPTSTLDNERIVKAKYLLRRGGYGRVGTATSVGGNAVNLPYGPFVPTGGFENDARILAIRDALYEAEARLWAYNLMELYSGDPSAPIGRRQSGQLSGFNTRYGRISSALGRPDLQQLDIVVQARALYTTMNNYRTSAGHATLDTNERNAGNTVSTMINNMNWDNPASVAAARAAYDALAPRGKARVTNYDMLKRAEGREDEIPANLVSVGGRSPSNGNGYSIAQWQGMADTFTDMIPGRPVEHIWITGMLSGGLTPTSLGGIRVNVDFNSIATDGKYAPPGYEPLTLAEWRAQHIDFAMAGTGRPTHEQFLTYFDEAGTKVWLQVENGYADMITLIDIYGDIFNVNEHPSVLGFAVDVEWYFGVEEDMGIPVPDAVCQMWNEHIYDTWGPGFQLLLKHYSTAYLPYTYRGGEPGKSEKVVFCNDSQGSGSVASYMQGFQEFAEMYPDNKVVDQIGYAPDRAWFFALDDPVVKSKSVMLGECALGSPDQEKGIVWVQASFNDPLTFWMGTDAQAASAVNATLNYLMIDNLTSWTTNDSPGYRLRRTLAGQTSSAGTLADAMFVASQRKSVDALPGGESNSGLTAARVEALKSFEAVAVDIRVRALPATSNLALRRDGGTVYAIWDTYMALSDAQKADVKEYARLLAAKQWIDKLARGASASISASPGVVVVNKPVDVFIALENFKDINLVKVEFTFDADYLSINGTSALTALNGFTILEASVDSYYGSSLYKATVTLMLPAAFASSWDPVDVLKISGVSKGKIGDTAVTLDSIKVVGKDANGAAADISCVILEGEADISVADWEPVFSPYDLNKGPLSSDRLTSIVDAIDLSIAVYFYQMRSADADWETPGFNSVTAKQADVNGSGVVNLADLIEIMANYGPYSVFPG